MIDTIVIVVFSVFIMLVGISFSKIKRGSLDYPLMQVTVVLGILMISYTAIGNNSLEGIKA